MKRENHAFDFKNSKTAKAIYGLQKRFAMIRDNLGDLSNEEIKNLAICLQSFPFTEKLEPRDTQEWREELLSRLNFLANARISMEALVYNAPENTLTPNVGIYIQNTASPDKSKGRTGKDKEGTLTIQFDESLEKLETKHIAKIMAHEFGHVWQVNNFKTHSAASDLNNYVDMAHALTAFTAICAAVTMANPIVLGGGAALMVSMELLRYGCNLLDYSSRHSMEFDADRFADIMVPEVKWRDTFKDVFKHADKNFDFSDDPKTYIQAWAHTAYNLLALADEHPCDMHRILASESFDTSRKDQSWVNKVKASRKEPEASHAASETPGGQAM